MSEPTTPTTAPAPEQQPPTTDTTGETMTIQAKELARLQKVDEVSGRVITQQHKVLDLKADWKRKADAALAAKKLFDEADANLLEMISEFTDPQQRLPFTLQGTDATPAEAAPPEPITAGWEMVPVSALGLPKGMAKKLAEFCKTIGDLEARRRDKGNALEIPGIGEKHAERINEAANEWLRQNRDKAVFDSAAAAPAANVPLADASHFKLLVDIKLDANDVRPAGSIYALGERMADGRLFLITSPDDGFSVKPDEVMGVNAAQRATKVKITQAVPGSDNDQDKLVPGFVADVTDWHGDNPIVKSGSGREVMVTAAEFEVVASVLAEVQPA